MREQPDQGRGFAISSTTELSDGSGKRVGRRSAKKRREGAHATVCCRVCIRATKPGDRRSVGEPTDRINNPSGTIRRSGGSGKGCEDCRHAALEGTSHP